MLVFIAVRHRWVCMLWGRFVFRFVVRLVVCVWDYVVLVFSLCCFACYFVFALVFICYRFAPGVS